MLLKMEVLCWILTICIILVVNSADPSSITYREQNWIREDSIEDGYTMDAYQNTTNVNNLMQCLIDCLEYSDCITIGFSEPARLCDMYNSDLTDQQSRLSFQEGTLFYKATCGVNGYTYVRHLDVCMKRHDVPETFDKARQSCQAEGGDLLRVLSQEVRDYLFEVLKRNQGQIYYWLGAVQVSAAEWNWLDGKPLTYDFWKSGEPNNVGEQCGFVENNNGNLQLLDGNCGSSFRYVCEIY